MQFTFSLIASLWSICVLDFFFLFCQRQLQTTSKEEKKERGSGYKIWPFFLLCVYVCALNLTTGHREGRERVLCCWSPPLPFACLSDVLLGWAPHSDGVDKMTGGGHTPVNVNLAAKHRFPRSTEAPTRQKRKRERAVVYKKESPKELDIYIKHTGSQACITTCTVPALIEA